MGKTLHSSGANNASAIANNSCIAINNVIFTAATEANRQFTQRGLGTWSKLGFRTNATGASRNVKTRINAADGAQTASATDSTAGFWEDTSNTDAPSAGDEVNIRLAETGSNPTVYKTRLVFEASSGSKSFLQAFNGQANIGGGVTSFYKMAGDSSTTANTTEANSKCRFRSACTLRNGFIRVSSNSQSTTSNLRTRINGGNGNVNASITASTTGFFEDTSNTDSVAAGDDVNFSLTTGTGGFLTAEVMSVQADWSTAQNDGFAAFTSSAGSTRGADAASHYFPLQGEIGTLSSTTESNSQAPPGFDITISRLRLYISSNTYTGDFTIRSRNNTANGNQTITVPTTSTGLFEDTTNSDSVSAANPFNGVWSGGTAGTAYIHWVGITMNDPNAGGATTLPPGKLIDGILTRPKLIQGRLAA